MSLSQLSSNQLAQLIRLVKDKEIVQAKLNQINAAIDQLEKGKAPLRKVGRPSLGDTPKASGKKGKSVRLKDGVLSALTKAGAEGLTVSELAEKLGVDKRNIFSWFYTTGKKNAKIKQVGAAKYALTA